MPAVRAKDFITGALRKIVKDPNATVRQRLDAIDRLATMGKVYKVNLTTQVFSRPPKPPVDDEIVAETQPQDEGAELLKQFNEQHYNGGNPCRE